MKGNLILKSCFIVLICVLCLFSFSFSCFADAEKIGDYVLNGGVGSWGYASRYFYITPQAAGYSTVIQNAMDSWIYTTSRLSISTSISWLRTYTQSLSVMDILLGDFYNPSIGAMTNHYLFGSPVVPVYQNWGWCDIRLNYCFYGGGFNNLSDYNKQGTVAHEMGHVFGLDETNYDTRSIMCQLGANREVNEPQAGDLATIQEMYP